ncbi:MAG: hypothetical protein M1541_08825, partial [Acidobacteria bacterium]|nr:hypothetical protein [Acidobacteriota bacterium]
HGLNLLASYMFSKTISDGRGESGAGGVSDSLPQNPLDLAAERSLADEHRPHRFVASPVYQLPFGRGRAFMSSAPGWVDALLGGWSLGGILTIESGRLASLTVLGDPSNTGGPDRPNVLGDWHMAASQRSLQEWFNTSAFTANSPYTFGNAARNLISGPGVFSLDAALHKEFRITERVRSQFRAEAFNLTNTPQFGVPNAEVGNASFGQINGASNPRNLQFALKLIF